VASPHEEVHNTYERSYDNASNSSTRSAGVRRIEECNYCRTPGIAISARRPCHNLNYPHHRHSRCCQDHRLPQSSNRGWRQPNGSQEPTEISRIGRLLRGGETPDWISRLRRSNPRAISHSTSYAFRWLHKARSLNDSRLTEGGAHIFLPLAPLPSPLQRR